MMDIHTATETAYKNGYARGFADGKGKWISVNERLPEQHKWVLVYCNGMVDTDFISASGGWYECSLMPITHWMPLPDAPKGE